MIIDEVGFEPVMNTDCMYHEASRDTRGGEAWSAEDVRFCVCHDKGGLACGHVPAPPASGGRGAE